MLHDPQFWILIAFIIFIAVVFKPIKIILTKGLDKKIFEIKNSIEEAEKIKRQAQLTLSEIKKRENDLKGEIDTSQNDAKEKLSLIEKNINKKLEEKINKHNELTINRIEQMTRDANVEVQNYIVQNAIETTFAILEKKLNQSEKQKLINTSISELNSILKH